jgi:hypothetical protein
MDMESEPKSVEGRWMAGVARTRRSREQSVIVAVWGGPGGVGGLAAAWAGANAAAPA